MALVAARGLRKLRRHSNAPVAALQALAFPGRHNHEGLAAVLGNDDGFMAHLVAQSVKGLQKLAWR
ncbi:hypothetical protein MJC1_03573 [Methylocystis sp. MJC1]|nr:hypothetical protein MJC1_03573 [Methylocystis sp. MJC1]